MSKNFLSGIPSFFFNTSSTSPLRRQSYGASATSHLGGEGRDEGVFIKSRFHISVYRQYLLIKTINFRECPNILRKRLNLERF